MRSAAGQFNRALTPRLVIPGRALRQQREGKGTQEVEHSPQWKINIEFFCAFSLCPSHWVPFPRANAFAFALAGDDGVGFDLRGSRFA